MELSGDVLFERETAALRDRFAGGSFLWSQDSYAGVLPIGAPLQGAIEFGKPQHAPAGFDDPCDCDLDMDNLVDEEQAQAPQLDDDEIELDFREEESLVQETEEAADIEELADELDDLELEELEYDELTETYGSRGFGAVPASAVEIAGLETRKDGGAAASAGRGCIICMEDFGAGDELGAVPCSYRHEFHGI